MDFADPAALQRFSLARPREFWRLLLDWAELPMEGEADPICTDTRCEHARFFPNLRLNYAEAIHIIALSPDNRRLAVATGSTGSFIDFLLWQPKDLISEACRVLPRNLTGDEWKLYFRDEPYRKTCPGLP